MPHFSECCGTDEYICQKCATVHCGNCEPSSYMGGVVPDGRVTNICPDCLERYTDWKIIAKPKREPVKFGMFMGVVYRISVKNINKLKPRHACPYCSRSYNMKNLMRASEGKWVFRCPTCSTVIEVVR